MHHYVIEGKAGSGKTTEGLKIALGEDKKIVIIRNTVQVHDIGFLPGNVDEKIAPFFQMYGPLFARFTKTPLSILVDKRRVTFHCTSFLRGLTFNNCVVIVDESQDLTLHELETVLTRVGENSKLIVVGDNDQMDIPQDQSGFAEFCQAFKQSPSVTSMVMTDNFRSGLITEYFSHKDRMTGGIGFLQEK